MSAYGDAVTALSPVGYWPLDSVTAVVGSNLTAMGGPGTAAAHVVGGPGSSTFVRNTSYYDGANEPNMEFKADVPFSMVFWCKPGSNSDLTDYNIASLRSTAGDLPGWQILQGFAAADRLSMVFDEGAAGEDQVDIIGVFTNSVVQFIAVTFDGTNLDAYRDGAYVGTIAPTKAIGDMGTAIFRVSANQSGNNGFTGELSEMAFFDFELTSGQILALYNAGIATPAIVPRMMVVN